MMKLSIISNSPSVNLLWFSLSSMANHVYNLTVSVLLFWAITRQLGIFIKRFLWIVYGVFYLCNIVGVYSSAVHARQLSSTSKILRWLCFTLFCRKNVSSNRQGSGLVYGMDVSHGQCYTHGSGSSCLHTYC